MFWAVSSDWLQGKEIEIVEIFKLSMLNSCIVFGLCGLFYPPIWDWIRSWTDWPSSFARIILCQYNSGTKDWKDKGTKTSSARAYLLVADTVTSLIRILVVICAITYKSINSYILRYTGQWGWSKVTTGKDKKMEMVLFTSTSV